MKPETGKGRDGETEGEPASSAEEDTGDGGTTGLDLTEEEQLVMNLLKEKSPLDLNELKATTGLSNKKWDTAIKGLRAKELVTVEKTGEGLFVELV